MVTLGNLRDPHTLLAVFGLLLTAGLLARRVPAAMLMGILVTTALGIAAGLVPWHPQPYSLTDLSATALKLDVGATLRLGFFEIIFVFLFIDMFDNIGTLVAVGTRAGLFNHAHAIPRVNRILYADACATIVGSLTGTSTVVSYIESAAGVAAGGRSGVTAIVTGAMFAVALFVAPLVGAIPAAATAPALIVVGSLMMTAIGEVDWRDPEVAIPGVPDDAGDPADVQHRERAGVRVYCIHGAEGGAGQISGSELAGLCADGVVCGEVRLFGRVGGGSGDPPQAWRPAPQGRGLLGWGG